MSSINAETQPSDLVCCHAVTASLKFDDGSYDYSLGEFWGADDDQVLSFIRKVEKKFRAKTKKHGFLNSSASSAIPVALKKYIPVSSKGQSFTDLTNSLMGQLKLKANNLAQGSLRGGNIVFIHYKTVGDIEDSGRLLVVMVDDKEAFNFDDKLRPKQLSSIDLDALRQAASFDITLFESVHPNNNGNPYLNFIEGKSTSGFFKEAMGCEDDIDNTRSAEQLFSALDELLAAPQIDSELRIAVREGIKDFLVSKKKSEESFVTLDQIDHKLVDLMPEDIMSEVLGEKRFSEFANEKEFEIDYQFEPTGPSIAKGGRFYVNDEDSNFKLDVSKSCIGSQGSGKLIELSPDGKHLMVPIDDKKQQELNKITGNVDAEE